MKTLVESLFDKDLITNGLLDSKRFRDWINQPDTLWYLYRYWEADETGDFESFMPDYWKEYKPIVDAIIKEDPFVIYSYSPDSIGFDDELETIFGSEEAFESWIEDATNEIVRQSTQKEGGIYKTWFKGGLPKRSSVAYFISTIGEYYNNDIIKPGRVAGGIFLTDEETITVYLFKKNANKDILKLFNLK